MSEVHKLKSFVDCFRQQSTEQNKVHHVERWYDRHTRSWVVQKMNCAGDQLGTADYVGSKREAIALERAYKQEIEHE